MNIPLLTPPRLTLLAFIVLLNGCHEPQTSGNAEKPSANPSATVKPALTVTTGRPIAQDWPLTLNATGNVAAWQEAIIAAEVGGYRISAVHVEVGSRVKKGQVLATIAGDEVATTVAEQRAAVAEAEATLAEAKANVLRSQQLREKGFYSAQQVTREETNADTAQARLNAAHARLNAAQLRQSKTAVTAPDDGTISARNATVGSLTENGRELFRLIRGSRLEWRAEVPAHQLHLLKTGQIARLTAADGESIEGKLRIVAPTVDPQSRVGLVYVDLPSSASRHLGAGMFARGSFDLGQQKALTLPQSAVLLRDGFAYLFTIETRLPDGLLKISQRKVQTGRRLGQAIEILDLPVDTEVVTQGVGFLSDGDTVRGQ